MGDFYNFIKQHSRGLELDLGAVERRDGGLGERAGHRAGRQRRQHRRALAQPRRPPRLPRLSRLPSIWTTYGLL